MRTDSPIITGLMSALAMISVAGCAHPIGIGALGWNSARRQSPLAGVEGQDAVILCLAVVERPINDSYISTKLWDLIDEQVVPFESKSRLAENGVRVGTLSGQPPQAFLEILGSDRSCINPRQIQTRFGQASCLNVGSSRDHISCKMSTLEATDEVNHEKATFQWEIITSRGEPGRLKIALCPQIRHGEAQMEPKAVHDKAGILTWQLQSQQQTQRLPAGALEVEVRPGEFLLVGASGDDRATLGSACFRQIDSRGSVQRMLIIRAARKGTEIQENAIRPDGPKPLALLAQD